MLTYWYLINQMPSAVLNNKIPHSILYPHHSLHSVSHRVFGSTCFIHNVSLELDKLSARSHKCVLLGYTRSQKGYNCYSLSLHRYFVSADVTFFESVSYYRTSTGSESPLPMFSSSSVSTPMQ